MLTTKELAKREGVKVTTILQSRWLHGHYKGYKPVKFKGRQYVWQREAR